MGNKKNIDRLFQEQFKGFHQTPNSNIWENIQKDLTSSQPKKKRLLPFWLQLSSIAAAIIVLITVGVKQFSTEKTPTIIVETPIINNNVNTANSNEDIENSIQEISNTKKENVIAGKNNSIVNTNSTVNNLKNNSITTSQSSNETTNLFKVKNKFATHKTNTSEEKKNISTPNLNKRETRVKFNNNTIAMTSTNSITINEIKNKKTSSSEKIIKKNELISQSKINTLVTNITANQNGLIKEKLSETDANRTNEDFNPKPVSINNSIATKSINKTTIDPKKKEEGTVVEEEITEENKIAITDAIANQEEKETIEDEEEANQYLKKWNVATTIAPVYYNSLNSESPIDSQFSGNKKKGQVNTSYGINVSYALNKKFSIRTGIHKLELGYDTQDVAVLPISSTSGNTGNLDLKGLDAAPGVNLNITNANSFSVSQIPSGFSTLFDSSLNQRLGYIEVPLEVAYRISNKKMKVNVIAGVSTFILNKNEIYSETNGKKTYLGSGNNLNNTSFSTNIGVGFNYNLSKHLNFNFEPMFKYQVNSFTKDAGNFKPYILGIYSGFSYKF